jgi:hypothetical protein
MGVKKTDTGLALSTCRANGGERNKISELQKLMTWQKLPRAPEARTCSIYVLCFTANLQSDI